MKFEKQIYTGVPHLKPTPKTAVYCGYPLSEGWRTRRRVEKLREKAQCTTSLIFSKFVGYMSKHALYYACHCDELLLDLRFPCPPLRCAHE